MTVLLRQATHADESSCAKVVFDSFGDLDLRPTYDEHRTHRLGLGPGLPPYSLLFLCLSTLLCKIRQQGVFLRILLFVYRMFSPGTTFKPSGRNPGSPPLPHRLLPEQILQQNIDPGKDSLFRRGHLFWRAGPQPR